MERRLLVRPSASDLGLPEKSLDQIRALASTVRFEWGFFQTAAIAADLWEWRDSPRSQWQIVEKLFPGLKQAFVAFARKSQSAVFFSEQQLFIAQRLLVEHGAVGPMTGSPSTQESEAWKQLLLYAHDFEVEASPWRKHGRTPDALSRQEVLAYMLRSGAYFDRPHLLNSLARTYSILFERARGLEAISDLPLDVWAASAHQLSLDEQFAAGWGAAALLDVWEPASDKIVLPPDFCETTALAAKMAEVTTALSADRQEYLDLFKASANYGTTEDIAWDITPFLFKPLLRTSDHDLVSVSPRCLASWLSDGFYHRLLRRAQEDGMKKSNLFSQAYGIWTEHYAVEVARTSLVGRKVLIAGHEDYPDGSTPDLMIQDHRDIIVVEIRSGSLRRQFRISGSESDLNFELEKTLFEKLDQFDKGFADLVAGKHHVQGFDFAAAERFWPIVVIPTMLMGPEIYDLASERKPQIFEDARVQPVVILDIEDLELLLALGEKNRIPTLLKARQRTKYRERGFAEWAIDRFSARPNLRPRLVEETFKRATQAGAATLGL
jgi:hypothetical protein